MLHTATLPVQFRPVACSIHSMKQIAAGGTASPGTLTAITPGLTPPGSQRCQRRLRNRGRWQLPATEQSPGCLCCHFHHGGSRRARDKVPAAG